MLGTVAPGQVLGLPHVWVLHMVEVRNCGMHGMHVLSSTTKVQKQK